MEKICSPSLRKRRARKELCAMSKQEEFLYLKNNPHQNRRRCKCEKCTLWCRLYRAILRRFVPSRLGKKFCLLEWHEEQERKKRERMERDPRVHIHYVWEDPEFSLCYLWHPVAFSLWLRFGYRVRKHWNKIKKDMKRKKKEAAKRRSSGTGTTIIVNIPHASLDIPAGINFYPDSEELHDIAMRMSDLYTDELLPSLPGIEIVKAPICRIVVDTERYDDDAKEPAAKFGQGVIYTKDYLGRDLRPEPTDEERQHLLSSYYRPHHSRLYDLCIDSLRTYGKIIILDLHSYPSSYNMGSGQGDETPDICIGYEAPHYAENTLQKLATIILKHGFTGGINVPFSGAIVPSGVEDYDCVQSYMVEIKRSLYMDETTMERNAAGMQKVSDLLLDIIAALKKAAR